MEIDFSEVLREKRQIVWREIEKYLQKPLDLQGKFAIKPKYQKDVDFHWQIVSDYPRRQGKYLRPALVLLTAGAMGFPRDKAIKTAAAMQTSEDWILGHDDFEDDSLQRRGQPALHRLYGSELAVNAGDGLHILMWKMLRDNEKVIGSTLAFRIIDEFYQMLSRTVIGQTVEIKWTKENKTDLTDEDILFVIESKTVYYTIAGPMRLGAILAGATYQQLETIYEFAQSLGRCFQIKDDLLDLTSDFAGQKRQIGNDIYEGKRTIMLMHLFRFAQNTDKRRLELIMQKPRLEKTRKEVEWVIQKMQKYGSLDYVQNLAEEYAKGARDIFEQKLGFLKKQPERDQLKAGIDFILKRDH